MTLCDPPSSQQSNSPKFPAPPIGALSPVYPARPPYTCPASGIPVGRSQREEPRWKTVEKLEQLPLFPQTGPRGPARPTGYWYLHEVQNWLGLLRFWKLDSSWTPGPQTPLHPLPGFRNFPPPPRALDFPVILRFEILPIANPSPPSAISLWRRQAVNLADLTFPRRYLRLTRNPRLTYPRQVQQRPAPGPARVPHLPHLLRPSARPSSAIMPFI
jgi:hypothetical protein